MSKSVIPLPLIKTSSTRKLSKVKKIEPGTICRFVGDTSIDFFILESINESETLNLKVCNAVDFSQATFLITGKRPVRLYHRDSVDKANEEEIEFYNMLQGESSAF